MLAGLQQAERQIEGLGKDVLVDREALPLLSALDPGSDKKFPALIVYRRERLNLSPANLEAWQIFHDLSTSRPVGMAVGGIPQSEILAWFILRGRDVDRYLVAKLVALDRLFLADQGRKMAKAKGPK